MNITSLQSSCPISVCPQSNFTVTFYHNFQQKLNKCLIYIYEDSHCFSTSRVFKVWRLCDAVVFLVLWLQTVKIKRGMFLFFHSYEWCDKDDRLFPRLMGRWILFMFCGLANFLIKVYDSAADSPCYLSSRPLAALNERKNSLRENTVVTLTSCSPF